MRKFNKKLISIQKSSRFIFVCIAYLVTVAHSNRLHYKNSLNKSIETKTHNSLESRLLRITKISKKKVETTRETHSLRNWVIIFGIAATIISSLALLIFVINKNSKKYTNLSVLAHNIRKY